MARGATNTPAGVPRPLWLVLCWITLIAIGTVVLHAPASLSGQAIGWLDALFTSTSAVCVTGLSTIPVGDTLSGFGQSALLALIQIGGLGISTVSTLLLILAGQRSLAGEDEAGGALARIRIRPRRLVFFAVLITLVLEAAGGLLLLARFDGENAAWSSVFHSVSAFCNAGFSLHADSLTRYATDPVVNAVIGGLIILGGIGFIAIHQITAWIASRLRGRRQPLALHAWIVLFTSAALWILGTIVFLVLEYDNTLSLLGGGERLVAAAFQSITARTAGFNTLEVASLREPTLLLTMLLMLIGGGPGSCAGGLKVTTIVVVLAAIRARVRDDRSVAIRTRAVPRRTVARAFYIGTFSILFLGVVILALVVTEEVAPTAGIRNDRLTTIAFEAYSAFATVGLSTGITPNLSAAGKWIIIITMFVGRLGPLALATALFAPRPRAHYDFPEEDVAVG